MKFNLTSAKNVIDLAKKLMAGLNKLTVQDNLDGFLVKDLVIPANQTVSVRNELTFVPGQYIITNQIGNGLVTLIDEKTLYSDFFSNNEMVFYKDINDLSEKIIKFSKDEKLRKKIARAGKIKYTKYFNSNNVAQYIINKSFDLKLKNKSLWEK